MTSLSGKTALVTGASQGIGKAIAKALYGQGASLQLVGRSEARLASAARDYVDAAGPQPTFLEADLSSTHDVEKLAAAVMQKNERLDILVNCGGAYFRSPWAETSVNSVTSLLGTNVGGPLNLTLRLLPLLKRAMGDIVFINSSIVHSDGAHAGQFALTQHALRSFADSLRAEINEQGVRVLTVYPGRTATPRQEDIHDGEGKLYKPDRLLQPADVAGVVVACLSLADTAEVTDIQVRPRYKD